MITHCFGYLTSVCLFVTTCIMVIVVFLMLQSLTWNIDTLCINIISIDAYALLHQKAVLLTDFMLI